MGRLRDGYENPLFQSISEEVVDLFGTDAVFYSLDVCATADSKDALYGEPAKALTYKSYRIQALFSEYRDDFVSSAEGSVNENTNQIYVAINHILQAGMKPDELGDYIHEGDLIMLHFRGRQIVYSIIQVEREGHFNNSDNFTGYTLDCKRSSKYVPEKNILPIVKTL